MRPMTSSAPSWKMASLSDDIRPVLCRAYGVYDLLAGVCFYPYFFLRKSMQLFCRWRSHGKRLTCGKLRVIALRSALYMSSSEPIAISLSVSSAVCMVVRKFAYVMVVWIAVDHCRAQEEWMITSGPVLRSQPSWEYRHRARSGGMPGGSVLLSHKQGHVLCTLKG